MFILILCTTSNGNEIKCCLYIRIMSFCFYFALILQKQTNFFEETFMVHNANNAFSIYCVLIMIQFWTLNQSKIFLRTAQNLRLFTAKSKQRKDRRTGGAYLPDGLVLCPGLFRTLRCQHSQSPLIWLRLTPVQRSRNR